MNNKYCGTINEQSIDHMQAVKWCAVDYWLWCRWTINKWIMVVEPFKHIGKDILAKKTPKKWTFKTGKLFTWEFYIWREITFLWEFWWSLKKKTFYMVKYVYSPRYTVRFHWVSFYWSLRLQLYMFRTSWVHLQELLCRYCICRLWHVVIHVLPGTSSWYKVVGRILHTVYLVGLYIYI